MAGGGAERQLTYLARELAGFGWDVHVALVGRGPNWSRLQASGATIHEVASSGAYDARKVQRLRDIIGSVRPDLIQVWLLQMEVFGGMAALTTRTPWIFSERASAAMYGWTLKTAARTGVAQLASAVVSNSAAGDAYWQGRLVTRVPRYTIPNAIPLDEIAAATPATDEDAGIAHGEPMVLFAGRFEAQKNLPVLLEALRRVQTRRRVHAICCGDGHLRAWVEAWIAREMPAARIEIRGYTTELWSLMKRAAAFVLPSRFEGSPGVVLEAMACGTPLVVSDIPEHRELLDDTCALFADVESSVAFADAIEQVLDAPAAAAARAAAARGRLDRHAPATVARQYDELYRAMLAAEAAS
jgi:glycosyltransferase involved in cell wall biosynthesis